MNDKSVTLQIQMWGKNFDKYPVQYRLLGASFWITVFQNFL